LHFLLSDCLGELWATDMVVEEDAFGWTIWLVLDQRLTLATVVTVAGAHTTVDIVKTFPLLVIAVCLLMVSDYFMYFGSFIFGNTIIGN